MNPRVFTYSVRLAVVASFLLGREVAPLSPLRSPYREQRNPPPSEDPSLTAELAFIDSKHLFDVTHHLSKAEGQ